MYAYDDDDGETPVLTRTVTVTIPQPQLGAEEAVSAPSSPIDATALAALVEAASTLWLTHGLQADSVARLANVTFSLENLESNTLGLAESSPGGMLIRIDADAAGRGWFVDPTPFESDEFGARSGSEYAALPGSVADGEVPILTPSSHV